MSDANAFSFSQFVPGFDFLKQLSQTPAASPQANHWIAPTLDPVEIEKRIEELKTVMFWLEQNSKAVAASVQALEVQLMTLKTLKGMNLSMAQLAKSMEIKPTMFSSRPSADNAHQAAPFAWGPKSEAGAGSRANGSTDSSSATMNWPFGQDTSHKASPNDRAQSEKAPEPETSFGEEGKQQASTDKGSTAAPDPMQWWAALSQQFQTIASKTLTDIQNAQKAHKEHQNNKENKENKEQTETVAHARDPARAQAGPKATPSAPPKSAPRSAAAPVSKPASKAAPKAAPKVENTKIKVNAKVNPKGKGKTRVKTQAKALAQGPAKTPSSPLSPTPPKKPAKTLGTLVSQASKAPTSVKSSDKSSVKSSRKAAPKPRVNPSAFKGLDTLF